MKGDLGDSREHSRQEPEIVISRPGAGHRPRVAPEHGYQRRFGAARARLASQRRECPGHRRATRRREHRSFHHPIPQGSNRRTRRRADSHYSRPRRAPSAIGRTQTDRAQVNRISRQVDSRVGRSGSRRTHDQEAGGCLPPVSSQETDAGHRGSATRPSAASRQDRSKRRISFRPPRGSR